MGVKDTGLDCASMTGMLVTDQIGRACLILLRKIFPRRFFCPPRIDPWQAHTSELPRLVWAPR